MSKPKQVYIHALCDDGQATLLRGFAAQIDRLTMPRLGVVKEIGQSIGLIILTTQEYEKIERKPKEDKSDSVKLILASTQNAVTKLALIADLLKT